VTVSSAYSAEAIAKVRLAVAINRETQLISDLLNHFESNVSNESVVVSKPGCDARFAQGNQAFEL
jgi:hypothetical protein